MSRYDDAKSLDLPAGVERLGYTLRRHGQRYSSNQCPCCGKADEGSNRLSLFVDGKGIWRWRCFVSGEGGTAIDFVMAALAKTQAEAVDYLLGDTGPAESFKPLPRAIPKSTEVEAEKQAAVESVLRLILDRGMTSEKGCLDYLVGRGISESKVIEAGQRGLIRMLPSQPHEAKRWLINNVGEVLLKKAGFWKEDSKMPGICFRPLVFLYPELKLAEFRIIREPSSDREAKSISYGRHEWPWVWRGAKTDRVRLVEGVIDALSVVELGFDGMVMGLPGCRNFKRYWVERVHKAYGSRFELGLDPDQPGMQAALAIGDVMSECGLPYEWVVPEGGDWNDLLKQMVGESRAAA